MDKTHLSMHSPSMIQGLRPSKVAASIKTELFSAAVGYVEPEIMAGVLAGEVNIGSGVVRCT
jgi:hypothetical protein